jgi:predicted aspartyl protease
MKSVSTAHPRYAQAQHKLAEYQQNLAQSQQQVKRSTKLLNPDGVVILSPSSRQPSTRTVAAARPVAAVPAKSLPPESKPDPDRIFYAPIVRREGNTPVIRVLFNDAQSFDMIVDTGASGTLITQQMAKTLGVVPVSQANVDTASQRGVTFPLGYVSSIKVGGATATNVLIAMAGPDLNVGLLGHDFFGHYDVTIREKEVEFRER